MTSTMNWWSPAGLSGLALAVLAGSSVAVWVLGRATHGRRVRALVAGGLTFQLVHVVEHVAQVGYWVRHGDRAPWLTPWAEVARDGVAFWCHIVPGAGNDTIRGNELLHLAGNTIFFVAAAALVALLGDQSVRARRWARLCLLVQSIHLAEHVALTASVFATGRARGLSTGFGLLDPGAPTSIAYRVLFHFGINLVATVAAVAAVRIATRQPLHREALVSVTPP